MSHEMIKINEKSMKIIEILSKIQLQPQEHARMRSMGPGPKIFSD